MTFFIYLVKKCKRKNVITPNETTKTKKQNKSKKKRSKANEMQVEELELPQ